MTTTAIIVDILIVGFFGLCWLSLLIAIFSPFELTHIGSFTDEIKTWITPITFGVIFFCYQFGMVINWSGAFLVKICFQKKYRDSVYKNEDLNYNDVKAVVDQYGSAEVHRYLRDDLVIIRLVRSGVINFFLIFVLSLFLHYWFVSIIGLLFMVVCSFYWFQRYRVYYHRILTLYKVINKN
jgi:hypothetical protein